MKKKFNSGVSLIEVLIAVFVLAVGVLGVTSAQMFSLKNNQSSYYRSQANLLVMDILDRMRANPEGVVDGDYASIDSTSTYTAPTCTAAAGCSTAEIATLDKAEWSGLFTNGANEGLIPGSTGTVATTLAGAAGSEATVVVTVTWSESQWDNVQSVNTDQDKTVTMTVTL